MASKFFCWFGIVQAPKSPNLTNQLSSVANSNEIMCADFLSWLYHLKRCILHWVCANVCMCVLVTPHVPKNDEWNARQMCVRALAHSRLLIYYLRAKHFSKKKKRRNKFKSHFNNRVIRTRSGTRICAGERACARDPATLCMIFIFYIILLIGVVFGFDYSFGFFLLCLFFALGPSLGCRYLVGSFIRSFVINL